MKVVIIGAGPAGLTAAYELLTRHRGFEVVVLEKTGAIGGISKTVWYNGNRMDIGGHRFFSKDQRVMNWWQNVMPLQGSPSLDDLLLGREMPLSPGGPDPQREDRVMLLRNRVSRIYYQGHFFDYPVSLKWKTLKAMGMATTLRVGLSYLRSVFHKLPETSLENFYVNSFGRKLYSMFFESYTEKLWGRHPRAISAEWGAQRTKGLSIRGVLTDMMKKLFLSKEKRKQSVQTSLIEEFRYPKFGPGQLWETVAEDIRGAGGDVRLGCGVTAVETDGNRVIAVRCRQGRRGRTPGSGCVFLVHAGQGSDRGHGRRPRGHSSIGRRPALPGFRHRRAFGQPFKPSQRDAAENAGQYHPGLLDLHSGS